MFEKLVEMEAERNMSTGDKVRAAVEQINTIKAGFMADRARIYSETRDRRTADAEINICRRKAKEDLQRIVDGAMPLVGDNATLGDALYYAAQDVEYVGNLEQLAAQMEG